MPPITWKRTLILFTLAMVGLGLTGASLSAATAGRAAGFATRPNLVVKLAPEAAARVALGCPSAAVLPIRQAPGEGAPIVDWLVAGVCVSFDGRSSSGRWVRIATGETQVSQPGWTEAAQLILSAPLADLAVVSALDLPGAALTAAGELRGCLRSVSGLNIRLGPAVTYRKVDMLRRGACEKLQGISPDRDWVKISRGWVSLYYLTVDGDPFTLPVIRLQARTP